jgi:hypothetical protein
VTKLVAGEAVAPFVLERLKKTLAHIDCINDLEEVATLHIGPNAILVALTLSFRRGSTTDMVRNAIHEITKALRKADGRVAYVYVRPSQRKFAVRRRPQSKEGSVNIIKHSSLVPVETSIITRLTESVSKTLSRSHLALSDLVFRPFCCSSMEATEPLNSVRGFCPF